MYPAPDTMHDDEKFIRSAYSMRLTGYALAIAPLAAAIFLDPKWVVAVGFAVLVLNVDWVEARLYDLCVRSRRANLLLAKKNSN